MFVILSLSVSFTIQDCMRLEKLKTEALHENFARSWKRELDSGAPDIRKAVLRGHWPIFLLTAAFYLISQATTFAGRFSIFLSIFFLGI